MFRARRRLGPSPIITSPFHQQLVAVALRQCYNPGHQEVVAEFGRFISIGRILRYMGERMDTESDIYGLLHCSCAQTNA